MIREGDPISYQRAVLDVLTKRVRLPLTIGQ